MQKAATGRFVVLDGIRGVAAICVFFRHAPDATLSQLLPGSYLAVDLFFVLSGFVLAYTYEDRLGPDFGVRSFLSARYVRLAPLFWVGLALGCAIALYSDWIFGGGEELVAVETVFDAFFLPIPLPLAHQDWSLLFPMNMPAWSLFFELGANLAFAILIVHAKIPVWLVVLFSAAALVICAVHYGDLNAGWIWRTTPGGAARVLYAFFAGVLICRIWRRYPPSFTVPAPILIFAVLAMLALPASGHQRIVVDLFAVFVVFPLTVYFGATTGSLKLAPFYSLAGAISYPLYVIHVPVLKTIELATAGLFGGLEFKEFGLAGTLGALVFCSALAYLLLHAYDGRVRRFISRAIMRVGSRKAVMTLPAPP